MEILKRFLRILSEEGIEFHITLGGRAINLDVDQVALFLEDRDAWETNFEAMERERMDRF